MTIDEVRALFDLPPHPRGKWFGELPADTGEQSAEFQRIQQGLTYGEMRVYLGLPEYPSPMLAASPLNPSLGALYQQALMVPPEGADGPDGQDGGEGPTGPEEEDQGQPSLLAQRLQRLGEHPAPYEPMQVGEEE
jgi:hypothetical protein